MSLFLEEVAQKLYAAFGAANRLQNLTIIAPSRRTRLFMNKYFSELAGGKPVWAPKYKSMVQLFSSASDLNLYDDSIQKISLVWELYRSYQKVLNTNESFDEFYFFGEILLNDFNDIDKALLDPVRIFRVISEHKELESLEFLDSEQIELIRKFFKFSKESVLQNKFFDIWNRLTLVYTDFNENLRRKKITYEGNLMRDVCEHFDVRKFDAEQYVFVGFNQMSPAEKMLLEKLKHKSFVFKDEADFEIISPAKFAFVEVLNPVMQTGYIREWLAGIKNPDFKKPNTAIILCDEKLLPATLSALPENTEPNIAILYSLIQSQTASELIHEMERLRKSDPAQKPKEYLLCLQEFILNQAEQKETKKQLEVVALSECHKMLTALNNIIAYIGSRDILYKLIKRLLISVKISYSGEPAEGLQIMAMSDTRSMDFENILMLSVNEGVFPKLESESSFIPVLLRGAFGLPSIPEQEAEEKYNLARLLKRAKNVTFAYNIGKKSAGKGEMSHYLMQLLLSGRDITRISLESEVKNNGVRKAISVPKTGEMIANLKTKYDENAKTPLSPSAFNKFIDCPLQFYFRYVAGIQKPEDAAEEINALTMGNIFHQTMQWYYQENHPLGDLETLIEKAFNEWYFEKKWNTKKIAEEYNGSQKLVFNVIRKMAKNTIEYDRKQNAEIRETETLHSFVITLRDGTKIKTGGIIDRIDKAGDTIRVVDYKTGKPAGDEDFPVDMAQIFESGRPKKSGYMFQTFLYCAILSETAYRANAISPALLFPLAAWKDDYRPALKFNKGDPVTDFGVLKNEFMEFFTNKLEDLFDESLPFSQCEKDDHCRICDYAGICSRP
ncbi:MAG: PD-(D/E)XK nuclease family protein [Fibrobacter sp.]|nr:PD-(D/E)XK nuclease family protein [Fibrobacter sp.]